MKSLDAYKLMGNNFIVFVLSGIPGSGKSTWCKENYPQLPVVSRDAVRAKLGYTSSSDEKVVLTNGQENEVTVEEYSQIAKYAKKKQSFIVDDTNSIPRYRKSLIKTLKDYGAYVIGVNVSTSLENSISRRKGQIDEIIIRKLYERYVPLYSYEVDELIEFKN